MPLTKRGTVLYGMMGAGKTPLGKGLANNLGQDFADTDDLIEVWFGKSCKAIIEDPVLNFPECQAEAIRAYRPNTPGVVATGGSVAMYPHLVHHLGRFGVPIFINADPHALEARLAPERIAALNNPRRLSFQDLYAERAEMYIEATEHTLTVPGDEDFDTTLARLTELRESIPF